MNVDDVAVEVSPRKIVATSLEDAAVEVSPRKIVATSLDVHLHRNPLY
jgi:hypothetical protein